MIALFNSLMHPKSITWMNHQQRPGKSLSPLLFSENRKAYCCDTVQVRSCPAVEVVIHIARKWAGFMKEQFPYATAQKSRKGGQEGLGLPNFHNENKYVFNKRPIRVCISCSWKCPRTFVHGSSHQTVFLFHWGFRGKVRTKDEGPRREPYLLKGTVAVPKQRLGRNRREKYISDEGPFICSPGK